MKKSIWVFVTQILLSFFFLQRLLQYMPNHPLGLLRMAIVIKNMMVMMTDTIQKIVLVFLMDAVTGNRQVII